MIERPEIIDAIGAALRRARVVALVGPRQSGKTTLARRFVELRAPAYFDLEDPQDTARLEEPMTALAKLRGLVVIDEVQRRPDLFPVLRVLSDRRPSPARFLVLGSASPALLQQSSESLAGRVEVVEVGGLRLSNVGEPRADRLWTRGGYPASFTARAEKDSFSWRSQFIRTLLEQDFPQLGIGAPAEAMRRFWTMLAHYHAQTWNAADPARSLGVSETTVRRYLDALSGVFMVRQLSAWHENLGKRQVKAPKIYFRDTGLLHTLLGIRSHAELLSHPRCGASWEGYVIEETLKSVAHDEAYFWATHQGAELDLLLFIGGRRLGIEVKRADAPRLTPSMTIAMRDLGLDELLVLYPGDRRYALAERISAVPFLEIARGTVGLNSRVRR